MGKQFLITEEEKKRILNLHEGATKKQYIKELYEKELEELDWGGVGTSTALGAGAGVFGGPVGVIGGAVVGAASEIFSQVFLGGSASRDAAEQIVQGCNSKGIGPTKMDDSSIDGVVDKLWDAMEGFGTDEDAVASAFNSLQTIPDLCAVVKRYSENHPGYELFDDLDGDFDLDSEWNEYIYQPMLRVYRKTEAINKKAEEDAASVERVKEKSNKTWLNFSCVTSHQEAKKTTMKYGSTYYTINGVEYYNNGTKKLADGTKVNFTCDDPEFKTKTSGAVKSGGGQNLSPRIKTVQKQIGVGESGSINQETIDTLYNKLSTNKTTPTGNVDDLA